jgi:hypothetical protein
MKTPEEQITETLYKACDKLERQHATLLAQTQRLYDALHKIARGFLTPDQLRRKAEKEYGLCYAEVLEMAYENMQEEAQRAIKGMRRPT